MSFTVLSKPFNDSFTFRLFYSLTKKYSLENDCIYMWSMFFEPNAKLFDYIDDETKIWHFKTELMHRAALRKSINNDFIILGIKDHLTVKNFNPWTEIKPQSIEYLEKMFSFYEDKKFLIFSSLENLESYIDAPNVVGIIPWGGDLTNQKNEYQNLSPILDKNFDSKYNFVSLNRSLRNHRLVNVSLLYGLDLNEFGLISCLQKHELPDSISYINWKMTPQLENIMDKGLEKIKQSNLSIEDNFEIYSKPNDNAGNFKNSLSAYYKNSFVEIVSETSFTETCFLITEKTANAFYGCNFPIILSSAGTVNFLRNIGLDMFDDIIDHSYDTITDPSERIYAALVSNKSLLTDNDQIKKLWKNNQSRFLKNVDFLKNNLYKYYENRARSIFSSIMEK